MSLMTTQTISYLFTVLRLLNLNEIILKKWVEIWQNIIKINRFCSLDINFLLGLAIYKLGKHDIGIHIFKLILKKDPKHFKTLVTLTQIEFMSLATSIGNLKNISIDGISRNFKLAHEVNPNDPIILHNLAEILIIKNEYQVAEHLLKRALKIINSLKITLEVKSGNPVCIKKEGTGETIQHEVNTTIQVEIENYEVNKIYSEINYSLGKIYHINWDFEMSETHYQNCVNAYQKHYAGLYNLAKVQWQLQKFQKAEDTLQKLIIILSHNDDVIKSILNDPTTNICSFTPTDESAKLFEPFELLAQVKSILGKKLDSLNLFKLCTIINNYSLDSYLALAFGYQSIDLELSIKCKQSYLIFFRLSKVKIK